MVSNLKWGICTASYLFLVLQLFRDWCCRLVVCFAVLLFCYVVILQLFRESFSVIGWCVSLSALYSYESDLR